jgi:hypothetical protein
MKKSLFVLVLLLAVSMATTAFGDTRFGKQGTLTASGTISYDNDTAEAGVGDQTGETKTSEFDFDPTVGYFVIDGLLVGGGLGYMSETETQVVKGGDDVETDSSAFGIQALVHYYYLLQGTLFLGGGGHIGYFSGSQGDNDMSGIGFGLQAGPTIAFGGKFGGYASLFATWDTVTLKGDNDFEVKTSGFGIGTELGLFF